MLECVCFLVSRHHLNNALNSLSLSQSFASLSLSHARQRCRSELSVAGFPSNSFRYFKLIDENFTKESLRELIKNECSPNQKTSCVQLWVQNLRICGQPKRKNVINRFHQPWLHHTLCYQELIHLPLANRFLSTSPLRISYSNMPP